MECNLYIMENKKGKHYIGITKIDPEKRLIKHNRGNVFSTKFFRPWKIIHIEKYNNYKEARQREKLIKSWHSGNAFKKFLSKAAGSSNGRTPPFEGGYPGSNPGPAALSRNLNSCPASGGVKRGEVGLHPLTIIKIESGANKNPTIEILSKIAKALDVGVAHPE